MSLEIRIIMEWQSLDAAEELSTVLTSGDHEDMGTSDLSNGTGVSHSPTSHRSQLSPSLPSLEVSKKKHGIFDLFKFTPLLSSDSISTFLRVG